MNIVFTNDQFNISNVYFNEPIQNTVMENSKFIKIIYSNELIILNGLFLLLNLKNINKDNYFKKIKIQYDFNTNKEVLQQIYEIENNILNKYNTPKNPRKILYETLNTGTIKIFPYNENDLTKINNFFLLKISGIWEDEYEYGLTYKILFT